MIRMLAQTVLTILGNTAGLIIASLVIPGFRINLSGFVISVLFFTVAQIILAPFVLKLSLKYLPAIRGGIALVTVFIVLLITSLFTDGLQLSGLATWVVAPLVIWASTVVAGVLLPMVVFKKALGNDDSSKRDVAQNIKDQL